MKAQFEKIHRNDTRSFIAYSYEKAEFDTPWHFHPELELTYILSGRGVRYVGNGFENFQEDDLVLLGPNVPHCWKNEGAQAGNAGAIVIQFTTDMLGEAWLQKGEFRSIADLIKRSSLGLKFDESISRRLKPELLSLVKSEPFERMILFLRILNDLSIHGKERPLSNGNHVDSLKTSEYQRINTVYQYVRAHFKEKITLAMISSEVHMSEEAFSRFFSKVMNKPFTTFLNEYRIASACQYLIESDLPIADVASASGFETLPFFYRQFEKFKKTSPKKFRDQYKKYIDS